MLKFADLLEKNAKELAALDTICMGGPIAPNSMFIIPEAAAVFRCEFEIFDHMIKWSVC
jgi:hypothetical protein